MTYSLFLDDERFPPNDGKNWEIARNFDDVLKLISTFGAPSYISFDHDLGEDEINGHEIVKKWLKWIWMAWKSLLKILDFMFILKTLSAKRILTSC